MSWIIDDNEYDKNKTVLNGNKFLLGNGYMGYRGTMEEYTKEQLVACTLSGIYDKVGDKWREPVNAPNGLFFRLYCGDQLLSVDKSDIKRHEQSLDIRNAVHTRETVFASQNNNTIKVCSERFLSLNNIHLMCVKYTVTVSDKCKLALETGIDGDVWDINGPHLTEMSGCSIDDAIMLDALTGECKHRVVVAECIETDLDEMDISMNDTSAIRRIEFEAKTGLEYSIIKYISVFTSLDEAEDPIKAAVGVCTSAKAEGYEKMLSLHTDLWDQRWKMSDVVIEGDEEAQLAIRYSIYHLLIAAPSHSEKVSIPARGLSSQVYKGAIFWDTEMFMLPFFIFTNPQIARNLLKYRCNTLDGARRKAVEYGFRGAFYAWESQETGNDACTHFVFTDVFSLRPMRNHFRDRQIHISADIVYGIWQYHSITGDESLLLEGGAEVVLECARFYLSYSYYKKDKHRYEILNVVGADEYHEGVDNNAYTNLMVKFTMEKALEITDLLKKRYPDKYIELLDKLDFYSDMESIKELNEQLFIPLPDAKTGLIEQFDGYFKLEDICVPELKKRIIDPTEYLGGPNGVATNTQVLKQADVVLMLNIFKDRYDYQVKKENWEYYEKRTEHGSSLSPCVYALVAADIGKIDWAYKYFMTTATIDLTGKSKQYSGGLYIGGTHPAANGGTWMSVVMGFAGVCPTEGTLKLSPKLPTAWKLLSFRLNWKKQIYNIEISKEMVKIHSAKENKKEGLFEVNGELSEVKAGQDLIVII